MEDKIFHFRSKIDKKVSLMLCIFFIVVTAIFIVNHVWIGCIIITIAALFVLNQYATTRYTINGNMLIIKSGPLYNHSIDITTIRKIKPSRNLLSAPALSFDRIEIIYNKFSAVLISPDDKSGFIKTLLRIHPGIQLAAKFMGDIE